MFSTAGMSWCGEEYEWLANILQPLAITCFVVGGGMVLIFLVVSVKRRRAGIADTTAPRGLFKRALLLLVGAELAIVMLSLALSEFSPLSVGNRWSRANLASTRAVKQGRLPEAESAGRLALRLAEQLGPHDRRLCMSLDRLRDVCVSQSKLPEAESLQRRLLNELQATRGPQDQDVLAAAMDLARLCFALGRHGEAARLAHKAGAARVSNNVAHASDLAAALRLSHPTLPRAAAPPSLTDQWEAVKARMIDGDEIWRWSTSPRTWAVGCGRRGVALLRQGEVVGALITELN